MSKSTKKKKKKTTERTKKKKKHKNKHLKKRKKKKIKKKKKNSISKGIVNKRTQHSTFRKMCTITNLNLHKNLERECKSLKL